jgi:protein involved in polysaccharide export with SLBB domain
MQVRALLVVLVVLVAVACADKATAPYPTTAPPASEDSQLGPGDLFDVRVFGEPDLSGTYQVDVDGTIDYPLIGKVPVGGKLPNEVAADLETRLSEGFLKNPQVDVFVKEARSKKVSVIGQVKSPGTFPYVDNMSIVEAITRAGGFTAMAKKNSVRVTRSHGGKTDTIVVAVDDIGQGKAPNFLLRPGDVVFVGERVF